MSTERCVSTCRQKGFAYAGTQYGAQCFCGNQYGRSGAASNCDMSCVGSPTETCGGAWANNVYATDAPRIVASGIQVVAGTYGRNCKQPRGNKTAHLAKECNGKASCDYVVSSQELGDPASGCSKDYVAEWRCGSDPTLRRAVVSPEAGYKKRVSLTCGVVGRPPVAR